MIRLLMLLMFFEPMTTGIHSPHIPPSTSGPDVKLEALNACRLVQCQNADGSFAPEKHLPCSTPLRNLCP
jgi:hypothetical protein